MREMVSEICFVERLSEMACVGGGDWERTIVIHRILKLTAWWKAESEGDGRSAFAGLEVLGEQ